MLCCKYNLQPIKLPNNKLVEPLEFKTAMSIFNDYYKDISCDYYRVLYNEATNTSILKQKPTQLLDKIILEYVKCRPNTYVITLWPNSISNQGYSELLTLFKY